MGHIKIFIVLTVTAIVAVAAKSVDEVKLGLLKRMLNLLEERGSCTDVTKSAKISVPGARGTADTVPVTGEICAVLAIHDDKDFDVVKIELKSKSGNVVIDLRSKFAMGFELLVNKKVVDSGKVSSPSSESVQSTLQYKGKPTDKLEIRPKYPENKEIGMKELKIQSC